HDCLRWKRRWDSRLFVYEIEDRDVRADLDLAVEEFGAGRRTAGEGSPGHHGPRIEVVTLLRDTVDSAQRNTGTLGEASRLVMRVRHRQGPRFLLQGAAVAAIHVHVAEVGYTGLEQSVCQFTITGQVTQRQSDAAAHVLPGDLADATPARAAEGSALASVFGVDAHGGRIDVLVDDAGLAGSIQYLSGAGLHVGPRGGGLRSGLLDAEREVGHVRYQLQGAGSVHLDIRRGGHAIGRCRQRRQQEQGGEPGVLHGITP